MLLDDLRPQGHGGDGAHGAHGMVREAHGEAEALLHVLYGGQVHLLRIRRIGAGAAQQRKLPVPRLPHGLHRLPDLLQGAHARGHDQRLPPGGHVFHQRQVYHLKGGNLVEFQSQSLQEIHGSPVEGGGEEVDACLFGLLLQLGLPFPGHVSLSVELIEVLALPCAVAHLKIAVAAVDGQGVRRVGLHLDAVCAAVLGGMDDLLRPLQAARVVGGHLRNEIHRTSFSDIAVPNLDSVHLLLHSSPGSALQCPLHTHSPPCRMRYFSSASRQSSSVSMSWTSSSDMTKGRVCSITRQPCRPKLSAFRQ